MNIILCELYQIFTDIEKYVAAAWITNKKYQNFS